jgi:hypothetical protein
MFRKTGQVSKHAAIVIEIILVLSCAVMGIKNIPKLSYRETLFWHLARGELESCEPNSSIGPASLACTSTGS